MSIREFVDSLKSKKKTELKSLYKKPVPETKGEMPVSQVFHKNVYHQADILYLPEDNETYNKFKYLLVVVDPYDNSVDAEPLTDILSKDNDVLGGFESIYARNYLNLPKIITLDKGSEFTQESVKNYFKERKINVKYSLTGRSRMLATVERMNQRIGTILMKRMASQELITGETNRDWVEDIVPLIKLLNERKKKPLTQEISPDPIADDYTGNLLKIGQEVRLQLDKPIDNVKGKRLIGGFRNSDARWTMKTYKITEVLLKPGFPPAYLTNANDNVSRTKNQLQVVSKKDKEPDARFIRGNPTTFIVSEILDKRINDRKTEYKVRWKGFKEDEATWISSKELDRTNALKEMKRKYNEEN